MNKEGLTYIDLFAGASGLSEGFYNAGFKPIAHIEMDSDACFTIRTRMAYHYLKETGQSQIYHNYLKGNLSREQLYKLIPEDIMNSVIHAKIDEDTIPKLFENISSLGQKVDLIVGGPPCQAFSLLGRHQENIQNDPRNFLYLQYGQFLKKFRPKAFVFENVLGLITARGEHFKNLQECFKEIGYSVHYKVLDASDYGVLQSRKRVIIIGWENSQNPGFPDIEKIANTFTVASVLEDLPKLAPGGGEKISKYKKQTNPYLETFAIRNGFEYVTQHITRPHNERDLAIYKCAIQKWDKERVRIKYPDLPAELKTHKNESSFVDRFKVVDGKGYSHTVVAHIAKDGHHYIHPDISQCRSLSIREAARLQSFPDDFYFEGSRSSAFKQIGNAVPPLMAHAIAKKIKELL